MKYDVYHAGASPRVVGDLALLDLEGSDELPGVRRVPVELRTDDAAFARGLAPDVIARTHVHAEIKAGVRLTGHGEHVMKNKRADQDGEDVYAKRVPGSGCGAIHCSK